MSIVYTSHYMEEVELLCSRVAIIDEGRIIAMDSIKNLIAMLGGGIIQIGLPSANQALLNELAALPAVQDACLDTPPVRPTGKEEPEQAEGNQSVIAEHPRTQPGDSFLASDG